jgi:hypothetical protein
VATLVSNTPFSCRDRRRTLGLKRVSKEISLSDYLSEKYGEQDSNKGRSNVHVNKAAPDSASHQLEAKGVRCLIRRFYPACTPSNRHSQKDQRSRVTIRSALSRSRGVANSPKRFCGDSCKQQGIYPAQSCCTAHRSRQRSGVERVGEDPLR